MDNNYRKMRRSSLLNEFFWWCAGVNREILRQCPTDYAKYAGMGGTILFTALMAMLSGGYAMYYVFNNPKIAIGFGVFWGLLIFNLDRFIVNTMYSDGKVTISWQELYSGLPRIIMAIFLGIVISTPLELKIYEKSINTEIKTMKQDKLKELLAADEAELDELNVRKDQILSRDIVDAAVGSARAAFTDANNELGTLQAQYNQLQSNISNLVTRRRYLSQVRDSVQYRRLSGEINKLTIQRNKLKPKITQLQTAKATEDLIYRQAIDQNKQQMNRDLIAINKDIDELKHKIKTAKKEYAPQLTDEFDGFQGRMMAFNSLKENESTWWAALFISLLFIVIETAPTFFKMMIASGPYDDLLRAEMHRVRVLSDKEISDLNDEVNTLIQISVAKNKAKLETELAANNKIMEKIALAQAELLQTAIDKWREEELAKINENPSAYIQTTNRL
ncbi:MAG: DUF4407 domain-containing protein [Prevotella sp.]|nr:DUF4407 domain-containing protein [Prevotella sp.]